MPFRPAARYVRVPHNGSVYAATGIWKTRRNVDHLSPEQAARAQAAAGIDSELTRYFKLLPAEQVEEAEIVDDEGDDRETLERRAGALGIKVTKNMKTETIHRKVKEAEAERAAEDDGEVSDDPAFATADTEDELDRLLKE